MRYKAKQKIKKGIRQGLPYTNQTDAFSRRDRKSELRLRSLLLCFPFPLSNIILPMAVSINLCKYSIWGSFFWQMIRPNKRQPDK